nr:MAG TPA: hypothetical protein [Caudoviricetes sp.]
MIVVLKVEKVSKVANESRWKVAGKSLESRWKVAKESFEFLSQSRTGVLPKS